MKPETAIETLGYVETSGQALHAARVLAEKVAAEGEKVATLVPQRVDLLVEAGLIQETEKEAAAEQLSTHEGTLNIVKNLVTMMGEQKQAFEQKQAAAGNGHAVPAANGNGQANGHRKQADAGLDYSEGGHVGRRRGAGEKSAADQALIEGLGLKGRLGNRQ